MNCNNGKRDINQQKRKIGKRKNNKYRIKQLYRSKLKQRQISQHITNKKKK